MHKGVLIGGAGAIAIAGLGATLIFATDTPRKATRPRDAVDDGADLSQRLSNADIAEGESLFGRCAACHSVGRGGADLDGPNLYGVVGHAIAERRPRYAYSAALRRTGGNWTAARLDAWLTSPASFAPGTTMSFAGLPGGQQRADVIAFLNAQGTGSPLP